MSAQTPLVQPEASAINIYYDPPLVIEESLSTTVLVSSWTSDIVRVETSLAQENHYVDHPLVAVRVFVTGSTVGDEIESLSSTILVSTSVTDVASKESLTAAVLLTKMKLRIWQRTKTGFILVGDPPRRT